MQHKALTKAFMVSLSLCFLAHNSSPIAMAKHTQEVSKFQSKGKSIRMEWFKPSGSGRHPIVILLHGQGGIDNSENNFFRYTATRLSQEGFNAGVLHYFDRDGIDYASSQQMGQHFTDWLNTIGDAITYAKKETGEEKVALLGHSLGAQLGLIQSSRDKRVACMVEMSGSLVFPLRKGDKLPPILILHGDADHVVSIQKERQLETILKKQGSYFDKHIYSGQGHSFDSDSISDIIERASKFLKKQLFLSAAYDSISTGT